MACSRLKAHRTAKSFKKEARAALRKVAALYPGLTIGKGNGGITVHATGLAVPSKAGVKLLG